MGLNDINASFLFPLRQQHFWLDDTSDSHCDPLAHVCKHFNTSPTYCSSRTIITLHGSIRGTAGAKVTLFQLRLSVPTPSPNSA